MSDRQRAKAAHEKVLSAVFYNDPYPTFELARTTLENLTSVTEVFLMEDFNLIRFCGVNHNGIEVYQIRNSSRRV